MKIANLVISKPLELGGLRFDSENDGIYNCDVAGLNLGDIFGGKVLFENCVFLDCKFQFPMQDYVGDLSKERPMPIIKSCTLRNCTIASKYFILCKKEE